MEVANPGCPVTRPGHGPFSEQRLATGGGNTRAPARRLGRRTGLERRLDGGGDQLRGFRVDDDVPAEQHAADHLPGVRGRVVRADGAGARTGGIGLPGYRRGLGHTWDCRRNQRKKSFVKRCRRVSGAIANGLAKWGSCYGWCSACRGFAAGRPGVLAAGMPKSRAGMTDEAFPARFRVPATWVFSLHVVQAGSARGRGRRPGLPRQRSTELVRSSRRPGESCPGFLTGLVPDGLAGSLSPSSGGRSRAPAAVRADGSAGQAASGWQRGACWQAAAPEATAASQLVPWTTME